MDLTNLPLVNHLPLDVRVGIVRVVSVIAIFIIFWLLRHLLSRVLLRPLHNRFSKNESKTDDQIDTIVGQLRDNPEPKTFDEVRSQGISVFAGDQTALEEARYTTLVPFQADGQTFLHGRWVIRRTDLADDVVVEPNHQGKLDEICAWKAIPPL